MRVKGEGQGDVGEVAGLLSFLSAVCAGATKEDILARCVCVCVRVSVGVSVSVCV